MKKYILIGFVMTLLIVSTVNAMAYSNETPKEFTHTVFAEECTATWCPNCPMGAEALHNIYESADYPFYYVALVNDMNPIAKQRNREYVWGLYKSYAFPTVYFDGGDTNFVGRGSTVEQTETEYRALIEQEGARTPNKPITMESTVTWEGSAKLSVTLKITNEGTTPYLGRVRSFVTEIVSRWEDQAGDPYHFALLDYAISRMVLLMPGKEKTLTGTFDGTVTHGNQTYADITSDNIMVISAIYNWRPHYRTGYTSDTYTQKYLANLVDQATAAIPT
jgi:thiol-disulfide isomerase/thioredoxin